MHHSSASLRGAKRGGGGLTALTSSPGKRMRHILHPNNAQHEQRSPRGTTLYTLPPPSSVTQPADKPRRSHILQRPVTTRSNLRSSSSKSLSRSQAGNSSLYICTLVLNVLPIPNHPPFFTADKRFSVSIVGRRQTEGSLWFLHDTCLHQHNPRGGVGGHARLSHPISFCGLSCRHLRIFHFSPEPWVQG